MSTPARGIEPLVESAFAALNKGDARLARELFAKAVASGRDEAPMHVGIAYACLALRDAPGAAAAIDRALELDPGNLRALLLKGDQFARDGDKRAASSFYLAALKGAPPPGQVSRELQGELARVQKICDGYAGEFEAALRSALGARGFSQASSARFAQSLDILVGRRQVYFQQPRTYFFPELAQVQFFERSLFPWMDALEAATAAIREELREVMREDSAFKPYVEGDPRRAQNAGDMMGNPDWSAFYLWKYGESIEANARRCPRTLEAIAGIPLVQMRNRSPSVLFSLLRPRARIPPHTGMVNTRVICHLPLIVPGECLFRVGNETRRWVEGRAWAFDDTIEHEAWNNTDATRVILLFEVWRPELTQEERELVAAMFDAIDAQSGERPRWEI